MLQKAIEEVKEVALMKSLSDQWQHSQLPALTQWDQSQLQWKVQN